MSAVPARSPAQRRRLLQAMGVVPLHLRRRVAAPATDIVEPEAAAVPAAGTVPLVLVLPTGADSRMLDLLGRAMQAAGAAFARAPRLEVVQGQLRPEPVAARAYLAFGEAQARALGRELPAEVVAAAEIQLVDVPEALCRADGKRRLWSAMHTLWRRGVRPSV